MRILQMVPALDSGGVETGTIDLAKALKKMGHEVFVMSSGGELVKELVKAGIEHVTYPIHVKSVSSLFLVKAVADFIRRERIEIVHARSRVPAWIGYLATCKLDSVFLTSCHGYYSEHFLSRVMGWGKEVIVISRVIGRHMMDDFGVSPDRIHLIYRGVDLDQYPFEAGKYSPGVKKEKFVVAHIGRITPIKGHPSFIKSFLLARQQIPGLEGWIIGSPEKGKENYLFELENMVQKLGLEKQIRFLGRRDDISEILRQADVLALTTNVQEAFGRVLIEAGARGTAVVATQVGGVVEIVEDQKTGLLVPVDDEKALACSFVDLYRHPEKAGKLAAALRQKVERDFSLNTMATKTVEVYQKALQRKKILITKLGSLGDLILAVPSFRMMRKKFPHAMVTLLVDTRWYGVMRLCPYLDEVWTYDRTRKRGRWLRMFKLVQRLRKERFDISVDLQNNSKTHLMAFLSGVPKRFGYVRGLSSRLLTHRAASFKKALPPVEHQFQVLSLLGIKDFQDHLELWLKSEDKARVNAMLQEAWVNDTQKLIGFSLSASQNWPTKNWPVDYFIRLSKELASQLNARIFLIGDEHALALAQNFDREEFPFVTNLVGKTNLQELMALISRLDVLVTGDSAPMHIAAALGTKFVALFGPTDPERHLPPAKDVVMLHKSIPCSPCYSGKCKAKEFLCMPGIQVEEVFRAIKQMLALEMREIQVS